MCPSLHNTRAHAHVDALFDECRGFPELVDASLIKSLLSRTSHPVHLACLRMQRSSLPQVFCRPVSSRSSFSHFARKIVVPVCRFLHFRFFTIQHIFTCDFKTSLVVENPTLRKRCSLIISVIRQLAGGREAELAAAGGSGDPGIAQP